MSGYKKLSEGINNSIKMAQRRRQLLRKHAAYLNKITDAIARIERRERQHERTFFSDMHSYSENAVSFSIELQQLESLKSPVLLNTLLRLEKVSGGSFDGTYDMQRQEAARAFELRVEHEKLYVTVTVRAVTRSNSPTCRRVLTRIERVERPVYEIVCD